MRKRWLINLGLALAVAALATIALLQPGKKEDAEHGTLTTLKAEDVVTVSISRPEQGEVVLKNTDGQWRMVQPHAARADRYRVDRLLQLLSAKSEGALPAEDLGKYGLDKPLAVVRFNDTEIRFGALHPYNNLQYVLHRGLVHLVPIAHLSETARSWQEFLSTALLEQHVRPTRFVFPAFSLLNKEGTWALTPANEQITGDRINSFVEEWRFARAFSVTRHEGKAPRAKIRIDYADGSAPEAKPKTLEVGIVATQPEVVLYRADEGLDYHFPASTGERLLELKPE